MDVVFTKILNMTIVASFLIAVVILLRFFLKNSPKWTRCIMWAMVAIRLVVPFSVESSLSLVPNAQKFNRTSDTSTAYINSAVSSYTSSQSTQSTPDILTIISFVWLVGVVIMLGYMFFSYIRLYKMVRERVKLKDNIWLCDHIRSPFVLGVFRPQIYLLSSMDDKESEYVLAHEQAHLKRYDNIWKPLGFVLLSVYWFNPLCWIAYWLFNKDIELSCDEMVVKTLDSSGKKAYSTALLACSSNHRVAVACPVAFAENNVKQRIKSVLSYKKPTVYIVVVTFVACIAVAVLFMTNPLSVSASTDTNQIKKKIEATAKATQQTTQTTTEAIATTNTVAVETTEKITEPFTVPPTEAVVEESNEDYYDDSYYEDSYNDSYSDDSYSYEDSNDSIVEIEEPPAINPEEFAHIYDGYSSSNDDNFGLSPQTNTNDDYVIQWDPVAP